MNHAPHPPGPLPAWQRRLMLIAGLLTAVILIIYACTEANL